MTKGKNDVVVAEDSPTWAIAYGAAGAGVLAALIWLVHLMMTTEALPGLRDYVIAFLVAFASGAAGLVIVYLIALRKARRKGRDRVQAS